MASSSKQMGTGCGCLFFGIFFAAGALFLVLMVNSFVIPEIRVNHSFVQNTCKVLGKRIGQSSDGESGTTYRPEIHIEYTVRGEQHKTWTYEITGTYSSGRSGKEAILKQFTVGQEYPCWFDPDNPGRAVLIRGYSWLMYLILIVPLIFMAIGGGGMYYFWSRRGLSPEQLSLASAGGGPRGACLSVGGIEYPTLPDHDLSDNRGETLRYRVPIGTTPTVMLLGLVGIAIFWNGIVSVFLGFVISSHVKGRPEWCLTIFLIPFVLVGLGLIVACGRQLLITLTIAPAVVEIDSHPLCPGQPTSILMTQAGRMRLHRIEAMLVCEESVTYTQGTDTRTETRRVHESVIVRQDHVEVHPGERWEHRGKFTVPADAMHTFVAANNKVQWKLVLKGDVALWPNFEWDYPIIVRPPEYAEGDKA